MTVELTGTIENIYATEQITEKFSKRVFWLREKSDNHPQIWEIQLTNKNCDLIDGYNCGNTITATVNIDGREHTKNGQTRVFNSLRAFKIEGVKQSAPVKQMQQQPIISPEDDSLPF